MIMWNELTQIGRINAHNVFLIPRNRVLTGMKLPSPPENNIGMKISFVKNFR